MKNFFIKEGYITNPVIKYSSNLNYWTKSRIKASEHFQYFVYSGLKKNIDYSKKSKLIDIGCGTGLKLNIIKDDNENLEIFGIDTEESIRVSKKYFETGKFFIDDLSNYNESLYKDYESSFDYIICSDVIEHLENPNKLLNLIKYLSHKNTLIIISTPDRIRFRGKRNNQPPNKDHIREWSSHELKEYLKSKNFRVIKQEYTLPVKISFTKIFFNEVFKRVIVLKNIFYNQVITMKLK